MHKVSRISIGGFRRLHSLDMEMRPLMVMIGANGVGKTSFLEALSLLAASAEGSMNRKLSEMGGIADVLTRGSVGGIRFQAKMDIPGHEPLKYDLSLDPKGQSYSISSELLTQQKTGFEEPFKHIESEHSDIRFFDTETGRLLRPDWEHNPLETSLAQVPRMYKQPEELRKVLSSVVQYHVLDVGLRAPVKLPQQMKPANFPGENGEDLIPFLYNLRESNPDRYEMIEDTLKAAFPGFESLSFPPVAAGMLSMTWREKYFRDPVFMHQLSEGTLRFLWLISLLQSPGLSTITMIDEPEVSLHPELLSLLADLMREASQRTQVIVATHSDRLIRFLEPKEVVVMDMNEEGLAEAHWADTLDLEEWLKEYTLDEVWRLGRMGGRA
ncbi:MAG: AAA family ATPase [Desulfatibacillum sp.]|nr:AAA family ATPase [Desulfatibacillum sp.]